MKTLSIILVIFAFLILFGGVAISNGAPQESVWVGIGCFFAIMARIAQASGQHDELMKARKGPIIKSDN